jgi:hypothetical protein
MSLSESLRSAIRTRIPSSLLMQCDVNDRIVVENVLTVLGEYTKINLNTCTVDIKENGYLITIPIQGDMEISLVELRTVESYSPARVMDIRVAIKNHTNCVLQIMIANEKSPVIVQETDVLRITKRRRWW